MLYGIVSHDFMIREMICPAGADAKRRPPKCTLHPTPLNRETPHLALITNIILLVPSSVLSLLHPTNQKSLLYTSTQASTAHQRQQIHLFIPAKATRQEVRVKAQRIAGIDEVLAAEAEAGRDEECVVGVRVQVFVESVGGRSWW